CGAPGGVFATFRGRLGPAQPSVAVPKPLVAHLERGLRPSGTRRAGEIVGFLAQVEIGVVDVSAGELPARGVGPRVGAPEDDELVVAADDLELVAPRGRDAVAVRMVAPAALLVEPRGFQPARVDRVERVAARVGQRRAGVTRERTRSSALPRIVRE